MKTFKDNAGRLWQVEITTDTVKRVHGLLGVHLAIETLSGDLMDRLVDDPVLLCDVLYAVCKPQADEAGVSDEDFGRAMAGDVIAQATDALLEELVGFFPQGRREVVAQALAKSRKLRGIAIDWATKRLAGDEIESELKRRLEAAGAGSGSSPDSSASTPAR